jgi:hypothetical protein
MVFCYIPFQTINYLLTALPFPLLDPIRSPGGIAYSTLHELDMKRSPSFEKKLASGNDAWRGEGAVFACAEHGAGIPFGITRSCCCGPGQEKGPRTATSLRRPRIAFAELDA